MTSTHLDLYALPNKSALVDAFVGKPLSSVRTPALIVNRDVFKRNCERLAGETARRGMKFRAHVKTHKTIEGTRLQLEASRSAGQGCALICSTMIELWQIIQSGLIDQGLVDDILYSMPVGEDKIPDLHEAQRKIGTKGVVRLMVDHPAQITALDRFTLSQSQSEHQEFKWSVFIKVDGGGRRAGVPPTSQQMKSIILAIQDSAHVEIYGFYSHFGQSYASTSLDKGAEYYKGEIECVNAAATFAKSLGSVPVNINGNKWVLSVGATPTAHAAVQQQQDGNVDEELQGELELHAGCYCMCDLQQRSTNLINDSQLALTVLARVVSTYPDRGQGGEAMCDAGVLAVSKDLGQYEGYGRIIKPDHLIGWDLGRISQEHGTLVKRKGLDTVGEIEIGDLIRIVPQHACLACAAFPWIYVVDQTQTQNQDQDQVVDVWVPWKGW